MAEKSSFKGKNRVFSFLVKIELPSKRTKKEPVKYLAKAYEFLVEFEIVDDDCPGGKSDGHCVQN